MYKDQRLFLYGKIVVLLYHLEIHGDHRGQARININFSVTINKERSRTLTQIKKPPDRFKSLTNQLFFNTLSHS